MQTVSLYLTNANFEKLQSIANEQNGISVTIIEKTLNFTDCVLSYVRLDTVIIKILNSK